jgi:hypothetical protein
MTDKAKVIKLEDKQKPKGKEQTLEVHDGKMGGKGSIGGSK